MTATALATEHGEQAAVVEWARWHVPHMPELALLYAVPNGGPRHPATARKLQAEGVAPGVPDLCLPVPQPRHYADDPPAPPFGVPGWYAGWYGELKRKGGRVAPVQAAWHARLREYGYKVDVCYGAEAMIGALCAYLGIG